MEKIESFEAKNIAVQHIVGAYSFYTILCGSDLGISALADGFARTAFDVFEKVSYTLDATKEFLNCQNGLFLTELSKKKSEKVNLEFPIIKDTPTIISAEYMYRIPYFISGQEMNLILCEDYGFMIEDK